MSRAETMSLKMLVSLAVILTAISGIMEVHSRHTFPSFIANSGYFLFSSLFYFALRDKLTDKTARFLIRIYLLICIGAVVSIAGTLFGF
ncbi:hypothetical protein FBZ90_11915 [Nitrospirillum pindoramense]|uniref:Uncharacterized protein n=2 Tax=Nitrospirillum amazonense TaxID=28077 RepID=A0A560GQG7_9PROT|nr:hypothetical protein FBZ90_11915 [Nitrospirillum amazonense]